MKLFTLGFTNKSAEEFFALLRQYEVRSLIDVRLNNVSQLAGFTKRNDLAYFLREICDISYVHMPLLAPTKSMLDEYKKNTGDWNAYEKRFLQLLEQRRIETELDQKIFDAACLLCSEHEPHFCHRRLVAEYLNRHWNNEFHIEHLV